MPWYSFNILWPAIVLTFLYDYFLYLVNMIRKVLSVFIMFIMLTSVSVGSLPMVFAELPDPPMGLGPNGPTTKTSIPISWTPNMNGGIPTSFKVYMATATSPGNFGAFNSGTDVTGTPPPTIFNATSLTAGTEYQFKVTATNADGEGLASNFFRMGTFAANVQEFSGSDSFADNHVFDDAVNFNGQQDFDDGMEFADNQSFVGQNHDFSDGAMKFGDGASFEGDETFGAAMDFSDGDMNFSGDNDFGAGTQFGAAQNFGNDVIRSLDYTLLVKTNADLTQVSALFALLDGDDSGSNASNNSSDSTTVVPTDNFAETNGDVFKGGKTVTVTFSDTTVGLQVHKVLFTDSPSSGTVGKIDCVNNSTCELADIGAVRFLDNTTVEFTQPVTQTFTGANTFGAGTSFNEGQKFTGTQTFGANTVFSEGTVFAEGQTFAAGTTFTGAQSFTEGMIFGNGLAFNDFLASELINLAPGTGLT